MRDGEEKRIYLRRRVSTKASAARASGTAADPYVISSAARLQAFAAAVDGGNTYAGRYVVLGADIDLTGTTDSVQCCAGILAGDTVSAAAKDDGSRGHDTIGARVDSCAAAGTVDVAGQNGMVWAGGLIGPNDEITREQLATMLYSYAKLKGVDTTQGGMAVREFNDYDSISAWANQSMAWAVNAGILSGRGNNTLAPTAGATRAEMAVMLQQFVGLMEQ